MQVNANSKIPILTSDIEKGEGFGNTTSTNQVVVSNSFESPGTFMCGGVASMLLSPVTTFVSTLSSYFSPVEPTESIDPYNTAYAKENSLNKTDHIYFSAYPLNLKPSESSHPDHGKRRLWMDKSDAVEALIINKQTSLIQTQVKDLCKKLNIDPSDVLLLARVTSEHLDGKWKTYHGYSLAMKNEVETKVGVNMIDELFAKGKQLIANDAELT